MAAIVQEIEPRQILGKKVKSLRRSGITPANIFGSGIASQAIQVPTLELEKTLKKAGYTQLITLKAPYGEERRVLLKELQRQPLTGQLLHVDFHQVRLTDKVKVSVPIVFEGEAPATRRKDLVMLEYLNNLDVECLPEEIPERIPVDVSELAEAGDRILASDLTLDEKINILTDADEVLVSVSQAKMEEEIPGEEAEAIETAAEQSEESTGETES